MIRTYSLDKITRIGKEHKICQDYSDTFQNNANRISNLIIVSDGCSSSNDTDIGSRIVARLARKIMTQFHFNFDNVKDSYIYFGDVLMNMATPIVSALGLDRTSLDSTLIISFVYNNDIITFMYGDGFIITIDKENKAEFTEIQFKNNAPYYLSARVIYPSIYEKNVTEPNMIIKDSSDINESESKDSNFPLYFSHDIDVYKCIIIASDGLSSFRNYSSENHPSTQEVITNLCGIKNYNGEFIQRRVGRMLSDYAKNSIYHYDDLSVAGISIYEE